MLLASGAPLAVGSVQPPGQPPARNAVEDGEVDRLGTAARFAVHLAEQFLRGEGGTSPKKEFTIPGVVDGLIRSRRGTVQVLDTAARWFGVTYREDKATVQESIRALVAAGEYPRAL